MHERIRDAFLQRWGHAVASRPRFTLVVCLLLAAVALVLTFWRLEFRPDRDELIDPDLTWNRRYAQFKEAHPDWDSLLVCIDSAPDDTDLDAWCRDIARRLRSAPRVSSADAGFLESQADPRLFRLAPEKEFESILLQLQAGRRLVSAEHANEALVLALNQLTDAQRDPQALSTLGELLSPYLQTMRGETPEFGFLQPSEPRWRALASESGRLRFIQVQFEADGIGLDRVSANLEWLRDRITVYVREDGRMDLDWGVTGIPAIEADETIQSIRDSTVSSIVAFLAITMLMLVVFRGVRVPLLAAGSLLIGMAWSFGWLVLVVGHLQLLSVVFSVILLGLGIDFALHLVARLELVQDEHADLPSAIARVFRGIGPGMLTGAVTTAAAFGATAFTEFKGMAEMGLIAGGGIVLCLIAMLCAFPAALALTGRWKRIIRHRPGGEEAHFAHGWLDPVDRHPWPTLLAAIVFIAAALWSAGRVQYDPNVLNLHPPGIESVVWEKRLVEDDARSVWSALIRTLPAAAADLTRRLRDLPTVSEVGGMGILYPHDLERRRSRVEQLRQTSAERLSVGADFATLQTQLATIRQGLAQRAETEPPETAEGLRGLLVTIDFTLRESRTISTDEQEARQARLNDAYVSARAVIADQIERALSPAPFTAENLPEFLQRQWVGEDGLWLLRVYPATDAQNRSILHPQRLGAFVNSIRRIAPDVLGPPVQIFESSELIVRSYIQAAVYALVAIFILLLLDFRSLADSVCSMIPVCIGFIGVFGLMGMGGIALNFANIIVMPMIFGIGVDAGVHMVHRWRVEPYGRPAGLSGATGRGITLTMLTTMIGFGSMMIAEHRGIRSLGFVMLAGLGVTLLACYVVLPPLLRLRTPAIDSHHT